VKENVTYLAWLALVASCHRGEKLKTDVNRNDF